MDHEHEQWAHWAHNRSEEAHFTAVSYDQKFLESLPDRGAIPQETTVGAIQDNISVLIYTSGTTGLPKAVRGTAGREYSTARSMATYLKLRQSDKFYTCLPLYHGAAQGLCVSPVIYSGASLRLARRFSHKNFWSDVASSKSTRLQYVGELCRYLVNAPPHPLETSHQVEEAWGNGKSKSPTSCFQADHCRYATGRLGKISPKVQDPSHPRTLCRH